MEIIYVNKKPKYIDYLFKHDGVTFHNPYQYDHYYGKDFLGDITYRYEFQPVKAKIKYNPLHGYEVHAVYGDTTEYIGVLVATSQEYDYDNPKLEYYIYTYGGKGYEIIESDDPDDVYEETLKYKTIYTPYEYYVQQRYKLE